MALITRFDTPASLRDVPAGSPFYSDWHTYLDGRLAPTTAGSGGGQFYDASETDIAVLGQRQLTWMAFPREVLMRGRDDRAAALAAAEDRSVQNEYCEWRSTRDASGKIHKIVFVTETPEYYEALWDEDRSAVVDLYRTLVNPAVVEADLDGGTGTYDRRNAWNNGDGIIHLRQSINTLDAALGLAQGSVNTAPAQTNYEVGPRPETSVDPRVKFDVGSLVRKGLSVTLNDPIGLYIVDWDDSGWAKPSGAPVDNYWRIVRGRPGQVLRLKYEVPPAEGFVVGDILIGGRPIAWGGQIAEHVTVTITGIAGVPGR